MNGFLLYYIIEHKENGDSLALNEMRSLRVGKSPQMLAETRVPNRIIAYSEKVYCVEYRGKVLSAQLANISVPLEVRFEMYLDVGDTNINCLCTKRVRKLVMVDDVNRQKDTPAFLVLSGDIVASVQLDLLETCHLYRIPTAYVSRW